MNIVTELIIEEKSLKTKMVRLTKPKAVVCPICWRANCKFFIRIQDLKFDDTERRKFFELFHRIVCPVCKCLRCKKFGQCCKEKRLDFKKKCLPFWATNNP